VLSIAFAAATTAAHKDEASQVLEAPFDRNVFDVLNQR
jgi:hypothetical protein